MYVQLCENISIKQNTLKRCIKQMLQYTCTSMYRGTGSYRLF